MLKAVLFDMDGVLVDSEEYIRNAAIEMFREKGHTVHALDFMPFVGCGENRFLGGVAEKYGIPMDIEKDKSRTYLIYEQICAGKLTALPGVFETIKLCRSLQLKTAVATSADEFKMLVNLKEIGLPLQTFDVTVFADMVIKKKPDPEIYLTAAEMLHLSPNECLVVEDAPSGLQAANAAGMRSLALSTTFPDDELGLADWIIPDLSHIKKDHFDW
ncbi:HAD family hydrolase [Bacteroidota bacterium]